ncbi:MAG: patatin-like phospholipase family protein [Gammaproteobacteria bacterium]
MSDHDPAAAEQSLQKIAISLSGGGVRALGFHIGVFSMLERLGLLGNIRILSSVSGGSMAGLGYSLAQHFGRSFQDFFDDFYEFLPQLNVLEELLERVTAEEPPSPSGRRDLITALADVYDDCYFRKFYSPYLDGDEVTFDVLLNQPGQGHLSEMCFNATEFKTGTAFRFQVSRYRCLIGNEHVSICRRHAAMMRVADVMAASSCIPAGMEPLFFPDDFHWPDDGRWEGKRPPARPSNDEIRAAMQRNTDTKEPNIVLMDGGVYDNQGITSTLLAINRLRTAIEPTETHECGFSLQEAGEPAGPRQWAEWMTGRVSGSDGRPGLEIGEDELDLLIISDTPVLKSSFYPKIPRPQAEGGEQEPIAEMVDAGRRQGGWLSRLTLGAVSRVAWVVLALLVLSAGITLLEVLHHVRNGWAGVPFGKQAFIVLHLAVPFLLLSLTATGLVIWKVQKRRTIAALRKLIPRWRGNPGRYVDNLRLGDLVTMGSLRAGSVSALTSSIYMNRIRALGYSTVYGRADLQDRIVSNEIFSLVEAGGGQDGFHEMLRERGVWPPPPEMIRINQRSANMATKLWIDQQPGDPLNDLDYLVAGGQSTFCYNFMRYLWLNRRRPDGTFDDAGIEALFERALEQWTRLHHDPLCLLRERKEHSRLPELRSAAGRREAEAA